MPIISIFFGIIVRMHYRDHNPPHVHAEYQGFEAFFDIRTGKISGGNFPNPAQMMMKRWIRKRKEELLANWERARHHEPLWRIEGADR